MRLNGLLISICIFAGTMAGAQDVFRPGNRRHERFEYFAFYLHGGVVTNLGDNAINQSAPEWGPYQYSGILDTLRAHKLKVISERRFPNIDDSIYVNKIARQVDSLLRSGIPAGNIILIGASAGSSIVLNVAARVKNQDLLFVIMGGCWSDDYKNYSDKDLYGNFLSIIEASDPHGTCSAIFKKREHIESFHEIKLKNGLSHGFIYKPYACWLEPVLQWFQIYATGYKARPATPVSGY